MATAPRACFWLCLLLGVGVPALGGDVAVTLPWGETVAVRAEPGQPAGATLRDGTRLIGVNMGWYTDARPGDAPLAEADREEIRQVLAVPSFYDKLHLLQLSGDSQRAVALVELIRDREFHAGGKDIIWRIELWYFEFQSGGWAKVSQQNKVLDRQRFSGRAAYENYVLVRRWVPRLGAIAPATSAIRLEASDLLKSSAGK